MRSTGINLQIDQIHNKMPSDSPCILSPGSYSLSVKKRSVLRPAVPARTEISLSATMMVTIYN